MFIRIINIIIFLFCIFLNAQNFNPKIINLPKKPSYQDFSFLKEELKDVKVIMLGENSHFDGNLFEMKTRIIKYLYQEMGFKTIAFESGVYDVWKAQNNIVLGVTPKEAFENSLFPIWSRTEEFQSFIEFYDKNKADLKVFGFDNQITGNYGRKLIVSELYEYCKNYNLPLTLQQDDFELLIESLNNSNFFDEKDIDYSQFTTALNLLLNEISKNNNTEDIHFYWYQITKSILSLGENSYLEKKEGFSPFYATYNDNIRDKQMADNLLAYINKNPNEKIICWGANTHFVNNMPSVNTPILNEFIPMGSYIKKELLDKTYSLALITAADSINLADKWEKTPIDTLSFEYNLKSRNVPTIFISSNQESMKTKQLNRLFSPIKFIKANLYLLHDGYLFLDTEKKSTIISIDSEEATADDSGKNKKNIIGRILDFESKKPIPFVSVLINQTGKGAITNVDGYFDLNIENTSFKEYISISALGYEELWFKINELPKEIHLKTQSTVLDEIIIYGKISPIAIIKKAINNIKTNYPVTPFNSTHYSNFNIKIEDDTLLDFDMITKQYDRGYTNKFRCSQNIQEIKWNIEPKIKPKNIHTFFTYPNPIVNAAFLKLQKYKKFKFEIESIIDYNGKEVYILTFSTDRMHFNFTRRPMLSEYYGKVYINKEDYAIVKIIQNWNWDTDENPFVLTQMYDNKYWPKDYNAIGYTRETSEATYYKEKSGLYFLKNSQTFFNGKIKDANEIIHDFIKKYSSYWYNVKLKNIEKISFKDESEEFKKIKYDKIFWENFTFPH